MADYTNPIPAGMRPEQVRWLEIQITDASITVSRHFGKCRQAF